MGCDGGTIPRRDELVRLKKKPEMKDKVADTAAKWRNCALSQQSLVEPIHACELGRLYNKESVIEHLLNKETKVKSGKHIRNLKDIIKLNLTPNKDFDAKTSKNGDSYIDTQKAEYICPVAGIEMNGVHKFCFLRKCGCVMSEKALTHVKSENCHKCGQKYDKDDIITLNGTEEEVEQLQLKLTARREIAKEEKKWKKAASGKRTASSNKAESTVKVAKKDVPSSSKKNVSRLKNGKKDKDYEESIKKMQPGYSIAKDPNASKTLKSLFTSHESAKNRVSAAWITYNPFYN